MSARHLVAEGEGKTDPKRQQKPKKQPSGARTHNPPRLVRVDIRVLKESVLDGQALVTLVSLKTSNLSLKNRNAIVVGEVFVIQDRRVRGGDGNWRFVARLALVTRLDSGAMQRLKC